jgi:hypothetical protein
MASRLKKTPKSTTVDESREREIMKAQMITAGGAGLRTWLGELI